MRGSWRAGAALATLAAASSVARFGGAPARADDTNYQNLLAGEKAAGMGGAYTAIANDPSATYYNPAGLVETAASTLSASLSFYGFQQGSIQQALTPPQGSSFTGSLSHGASAAFSQMTTVPGLAGSVNGIGKKDEKGRYAQAWGLSVMMLDAQSSTFNQTSFGPNSLQDLSQTLLDQTVWIGLGYARRESETLELGLSVDAIYRNVNRASRTISGSTLNAQGVAGSFFLDDTSLQMAVAGLFVEGGLLWKLLPDFTLGLSLASPSVTVFGTGSSDEIQSYNGSGSSAGLTDTAIQSLEANTLLPVHGRAGLAWKSGQRTLVDLDVSAWGPTSYSLINGPLPVGVQFPNFVRSVDRLPVVNLALGGQWLVADKYPLRGGLFTNRSSAPKIDSGPEPQLADVDVYGISAGITLPSEHTETTIGLVYSYGAGLGKVPASGATQASGVTFVPTPVTEGFLDVYLGGSYDF
ncbi:MAG: hypothetical protein ACYCWW_02540 [Deltaproteobacteria bacterium]